MSGNEQSTPGELLLVKAAVQGDSVAWRQLLALHEPRLRNMIQARMDPRLRRRLDVVDVLQEVYVAAAQSLEQYHRQPDVPLYLWLRGVARHKMLALHRDHLGAQMRDPRREMVAGGHLQASSINLAEMLAASDTRPSGKVQRDERKQKLIEALEQLEPTDREVLALRHFEQLSNAQTAEVLGIDISAASKRYRRALQRLAALLSGLDDA